MSIQHGVTIQLDKSYRLPLLKVPSDIIGRVVYDHWGYAIGKVEKFNWVMAYNATEECEVIGYIEFRKRDGDLSMTKVIRAEQPRMFLASELIL